VRFCNAGSIFDMKSLCDLSRVPRLGFLARVLRQSTARVSVLHRAMVTAASRGPDLPKLRFARSTNLTWTCKSTDCSAARAVWLASLGIRWCSFTSCLRAFVSSTANASCLKQGLSSSHRLLRASCLGRCGSWHHRSCVLA